MERFSKKLIAGILAVVLVFSALSGYFVYNTYAAKTIDESQTVSFAEFAARHNIPETTVFIGTHLIALEAATDELWDQAVNSKTASDQMSIYYKSELSNGAWFEVTDAENIKDITGEGNGIPVDESEIADLRVMYYTFDYGITRLAINDMRHCIFDGEYDYWDLYHLDELENTKNQYDVIVSRNSENSKMDKFYRDFLQNFFAKDLRNDVTQRADDALYALQDVYDALIAAERKDDADIIYELMAKLDNARRAEIFRQLIDEAEVVDQPAVEETTDDTGLLGGLIGTQEEVEATPTPTPRSYINLLDELVQKAEGTGYGGDDEFITNSDVVDAINSDSDECQQTYLEKSSNVLEQNGGRVIDSLIYEVSSNIIGESGNGLTSAMDGYITRLGHLFHIDDKKVVNAEDELAVIDGELITPVTDKFGSAAVERPSEKYNSLLNSGVSDSALKSALVEQEMDLEAIRLELQDVIRAKTDRMQVDEGLAFTYDRINLTQDMQNQIPNTDFMPNATAQVKRHIKWLSDLLAELYEKSKSGDSELDKLKDKADSLLNEIQKSLDENDYKTAKKLEAERNAVLDQIEAITGQPLDPNATAGDQALADAVRGIRGTSVLQDIANKAKDKLLNGEDISDEIDLLKMFGDEDGLNSLKDEANSLGNEEVSNQLSEALGDFDDGTGDGTGDATGLTSDDLLGLLENLLGDINNLSDEQLASAIRAMEMIYDMGYDSAGSLAARLAGIAKTKGNKYLYSKINNAKQYEYVNLQTLAEVAGYRWSYGDRKSTNALIGFGKNPTYQFAAGDEYIYEIINEETRAPKIRQLARMAQKAKASTCIYVVVDVAKDYFDCVACHIKKSNYGICLTSKLEGDAETLRDQLLPTIQGVN